jgi:undecaprenyl-phosphate 4-deoxy-4-formamido-L-arabinose transferase
MLERSTSAIDVSLVVPVFRSAEILPHLVEKVREAMSAMDGRPSFELILVNDVSPDHSWQVIKQLAEQHDFVIGICLAKNVGQHNATMAGLRHVRGEVIVIMDDDLQHPPTALSMLIGAIRSGHDVCYTRYENRQHALWKIVGSWFNDRVATVLLKKPKGLYLSSFKALHKRVAHAVVQYDGPYAYVDGLILDITQHITSVTIEHQQRFAGSGNYNLRRSLSLWLKMATSFSVFPLRMATLLGLSMTALSVLATAVIVVRKLLHPELPAGWASLIATILLVGGLQTFCLGIVGEYLGRAYLKINRKPQFVVRETTHGC